MKRCRTCILPATYPGIQFDEDGVCEFCRAAQSAPVPEDRGEALSELVRYAKALPAPYNTIVPFSGGKDSAFVLYYAKRVLGLTPISVHFDNGFQTDHAKVNLERIPRLLGIDLHVVQHDPRLMRQLYKCFLENVGELCTVCNAMGYLAIVSFAFRQQRKLGCSPLVIGGWSRTFEEMPRVYAFHIEYFASIVEKANLLDDVLESPTVDREAYEFLLRVEDPRKTTAMKTFIQLPDYVAWDTPHITKTLREELGWQTPRADFDTHFDCQAYHLAKFLEFRKYGFDQKIITLSAMVRHGQISRKDALAQHATQSFYEASEVRRTLEVLDVDPGAIAKDEMWHTG